MTKEEISFNEGVATFKRYIEEMKRNVKKYITSLKNIVRRLEKKFIRRLIV